jgi:hypothetical protein
MLHTQKGKSCSLQVQAWAFKNENNSNQQTAILGFKGQMIMVNT